MAPSASAKKGAAGKAAEAADEEHEVDMTSPVILDPVPSHTVQPLPGLPALPHEGETEEARKARIQRDTDTIARAKEIREGRAVHQAKIAAGPYGRTRRKSHWDYVLIEMKWMASDFAAERDWKLEAARQCAVLSAACQGVPKVKEDVALADKKRACAAVAKEIAAFWAKAWDRAREKPIPPAALLVPSERAGGKPAAAAEGLAKAGEGASANGVAGTAAPATEVGDGNKDGGSRGGVTLSHALHPTTDGDAGKQPAAAASAGADAAADAAAPPEVAADVAAPLKVEATPGTVVTGDGDVEMSDAGSGGGTDAKGEGAPVKVDDAATPAPSLRPQSLFPKTPPPPPGMSVIEQWACMKLHNDISRLKRDVIRAAIKAKEEEAEAAAGGKKTKAKDASTKKGGRKPPTPTARTSRRGKKSEEKESEAEEESEADEADAKESGANDGTEGGTMGDGVPLEDDAAAMPPPPPVYVPGGVPDAVLDDTLDFESVAPGTPPRLEGEEYPALLYECRPSQAERWWRESVHAETMKFADYERRLRDWEEDEKKRARAVVEAARQAAEAEALRLANERRRAAQAAQAAARAAAAAAAAAAAGMEMDEFDAKGKKRAHPAIDAKGNKRMRTSAAAAAAAREAASLGKRATADSSDDDEDGDMTLATLQKAGKKKDKDEKGKKKSKPKKRAAGVARPWTLIEDQLLCAIVHEFGSNWGLITDVFAASAPFKGVFRRAEQCRWRFQTLTQMAEGDADPNAVAALNLNKGSARQTMSRALPVEDDTARLHFERAAHCAVRHAKLRRAAAAERAGDDVTRRVNAHASWSLSAHGLRVADPLELADAALLESQRQQQQQQAHGQMQQVGGMPAVGGGGDQAAQQQQQRRQQQLQGMQTQQQGQMQGMVAMQQGQQQQMQQHHQMQMQMQQQQQQQQTLGVAGKTTKTGKPTKAAKAAQAAAAAAAAAAHQGGVGGAQMQQMGGMPGGTYQPMPGAGATMEMPTIPVSPAKGKKGGGAAASGLSPGLAPGMYNLGGGRGAARTSATTPRGGKGSGRKSKE